MPLELVPEEEMETKSKKAEKVDISKLNAKVTITSSKKIDTRIEIVKEEMGKVTPEQFESPKEGKEDKDDKKDKEIKEGVKDISKKSSGLIVKRIYFPDATYSVPANQKGFKDILKEFGLSWVRSMMKEYHDKEGKKLLTGMYAAADGHKKVFCIYEGNEKPATFILKLADTGGIFLLKMNSFCHNIGCIIDDKDETYANNVMLRLQEYGDINIPEKKEELEELDKAKKEGFEKKIIQRVEESVKKYIENYGEILKGRGISIETALFFKRKEIEQDVRWAVEHGF